MEGTSGIRQVQKPPYQRGEREKLVALLGKMIFQDLDAIYQLDNYCLNRHNMVDDRVRELLISRQILAEDGSLPRLTNDAMYQLRTGQVPFWVRDEY